MRVSEHRANQLEPGRILNEELFLYLVDLEVKRARRYQDFYCLLLLKMTPITNREGRGEAKTSFQTLTNLLLTEVRESDILGLLAENKLAILLPYADACAGGLAKSRLEGALAYYDFRSRGCEVGIRQVCFPINGNARDLIKKVLETDPS